MASPWRAPPGLLGTAALLAGLCIGAAEGHDHGVSRIKEGDTVSDDPIDVTLWVHILVQMVAFGVLFPMGMVLGMVKSRWHVPTQVLATSLAVLGYFLGHMHSGRQFTEHNAHALFAPALNLLLAAQVVVGAYLKLHLERGVHGRIRRAVRPVHGLVGKVLFPVASWAQMLLGGITALGFCQDDHLGQCLAHFIMGSAFIGYGAALTVVLVAGQLWMRRTGRSQEFFDSVVIGAWGCVNTFTEHRWGQAWSGNDWQHTTMGIVWWCAGLVGVWLSRDGEGRPRRNFVPGAVVFITGWAMSSHPQHLKISAMIHSMFGYTLMAAGLTRIIEIAFVLGDAPSLSEDGKKINSWQYIPVFLLFASGFLFMGATEEQISLVVDAGLDHVSYILILYSLAFLMFLFVHMLVHLFEHASADGVASAGPATQERVARDAEEFELEGLMSDDEDERGEGSRAADGPEKLTS